MKQRQKIAAALAAALAAGLPAQAQTTSPKVAPTVGHAMKFDATLTSNAILSRPDSDLVELPNGQRLRVGDIRQLSALAQKMQAKPGALAAPALAAKPAATGIRVSNAAELAAALKRPDGDTVVLPSGRRATVGQLRFVQPYVERKIGRALTAPAAQRPNLSGPAIKVTQQSDFRELLKQPDATVLEAPNGTRITVGELRQALAHSGR
jgi:hypothetical protein